MEGRLLTVGPRAGAGVQGRPCAGARRQPRGAAVDGWRERELGVALLGCQLRLQQPLPEQQGHRD